jgi:hypothetical protein
MLRRLARKWAAEIVAIGGTNPDDSLWRIWPDIDAPIVS